MVINRPNPYKINPDEINPDEINPDEFNPDEINPDEINGFSSTDSRQIYLKTISSYLNHCI